MLKSKEAAPGGLGGGEGAGGAHPSLDPFQAATYGGGAMAFNQFANMSQMPAFDFAAPQVQQMQMQQQMFMPT